MLLLPPVTTCSQSVTQQRLLLPPVTTCINCFDKKNNHVIAIRYHPLPHVARLLHNNCSCYLPLPLVSIYFAKSSNRYDLLQGYYMWLPVVLHIASLLPVHKKCCYPVAICDHMLYSCCTIILSIL